ncbi:orotidine-5'-phosphate decarboxylase [Nitratidesulfovibrio sp.]|uniref:orotidine-5'-phosphate decarboxylase n=1 Tax=Nitratidesulfovibrio sp. TaxID=2802297 RepID=UPI003341EA57
MAELVIALDYPAMDAALATARTLRGVAEDAGGRLWMKVGLELFTASGPEVVARLKDMGFPVFLDLKFHDIPNTVRGAVRSAVATGVDMCNIHLSGGERMCRAAVEGLAEGAAVRGHGVAPILLGVTVLTSVAPGELPGGADPSAEAARLAVCGRDWGLGGVVCSGHEAHGIKQRCGRDFVCLTPGIRPAAPPSHQHGGGSGGDDQRRVMTPAEAVRAGSDYLVVGRPVTGAAGPNGPADAVRGILAEMLGA